MTLEGLGGKSGHCQKGAGVWPPDGMDYHVCFGQDGDLRVSEIWDSQEKFEAFGARLSRSSPR
jgi:hypothetical protein